MCTTSKYRAIKLSLSSNAKSNVYYSFFQFPHAHTTYKTYLHDTSHYLPMCIPVKVVLVIGGGLHMGDLLSRWEQTYTMSHFLKKTDELSFVSFVLFSKMKSFYSDKVIAHYCWSTQSDQQRGAQTSFE